jgi:hypothetical protein
MVRSKLNALLQHSSDYDIIFVLEYFLPGDCNIADFFSRIESS